MTFKQKIKQHHLVLLQDKIDVYQDMISGLSNDAQNDSKGSAGDKHETALSMMHIEQEKLNYKLKEVLEQNKILNTIDETITHKVIALGSLVTVNEMMLFISTALPKIILNDKTIFAVSPQSPLGSKLMGKEVGFEFELQGKNYKIAFVE